MVYVLCNGTFHLLTTNLPYHIKILRHVTVIAHSRNVDLSKPCLRFIIAKCHDVELFFFAFVQYKCPSCLILGCRICRFFDPQEILKFDECTIYLFSRIRKKIQWQIWHFTNIDDAKESRNIVKCHFTSLCKKSVKYLDSRNLCFF